jgi:hypothetical protein
MIAYNDLTWVGDELFLGRKNVASIAGKPATSAAARIWLTAPLSEF